MTRLALARLAARLLALALLAPPLAAAEDAAGAPPAPGGAEPAPPPAPPDASATPPPPRRAEPAPIFEQPGVLTPRGKLALEPAFQYAYSSTNRVTLLGYTVIPSVTVGLINVQQVKSETFLGVLTARYGLTSRWELEAKLPYVVRAESVVALPLNSGSSTAAPVVSNTRGKGIGDIEGAARVQLNRTSDGPIYIGALRFKSRTGKDPFQTRTVQQTTAFNGASLEEELPCGSGFYSLQPGLSVLVPSDPVVFFGGVSYQHNFARHGVSQATDAGRVRLGTVAAGDIVTANLGMGLALNDRASLSLGYEQDSIDRTRVNGDPMPGSTRIELGTFVIGASYRASPATSISFAIGIGVTRDTPDVTVTLRLPTRL